MIRVPEYFQEKISSFMKITSLFVLLVFVCYSQNPKTDSLLKLIKNEKKDTDHILHLNVISRNYFDEGNLDTAIYYANTALKVCNENLKAIIDPETVKKLKLGQAHAYNNLAINYATMGNFPEGLKNFNASLKIYTDLGDKNKIADSYSGLGVFYQSQGNYTEAEKKYSNALILYRAIGDKKGEANANNSLGTLLQEQGNYVEALKSYLATLKISDETDNRKLKGITFMNIGNVYSAQGKYPEALKSHFESLKIFEEMKENRMILTIYTNIGSVYNQQEKLPQALKYLQMALKLCDETGDKASKSGIYNNIGNAYAKQKKYDEALKYMRSGLKINEEFGDLYGIAHCYGNIGSIYLDRAESALTLSEKKSHALYGIENIKASLKIFEELGVKDGMAISFTNLGTLMAILEKPKEARDYLWKANALAAEIGDKACLQMTYITLAKLDSTGGDYKAAYANYKLSVMYRDSLDNEESRKKMVQNEMSYEFEKKEMATRAEQEKKDVVTRKEQERQNIILFSVMGGLLLVIVFAVFIFRSLRVTRSQKNIIELQKKDVETQKHIVEVKHREITDSINYAERIQRSFLASKETLDKYLVDYFVLFKPKDVVSGDFYWGHKENQEKSDDDHFFYLAVADSTGHGVPGAIMSLLNITSLEKAIEHYKNPAEILSHTRENIIHRLKKDGSEEGGKDGMDCCLLAFDFKRNKLFIAAANNPVWIIRNNETIEIKPDKMPVGKHDRQNESFTQHEFDLQKGDVIYALTDGFPDQFGGEKGKKFMSKNLRVLVEKNSHLPMIKQKELLENTLEKWMGNLEQVDDITIVGIRI